ncbi:hypothetical protein J6O86_09525 [bacterium]|nr:hypothetical protein [bacterium]
MTKFKKTILIDLDGVLNTYNGEYDENFIPPIKDGAKEFLLNLSANYKINIFTTRNLLLTSKWLNENDLNEFIDDITNIKKPSYLIIDDRCINFDGNYDDLIDKISHFKVWYK